MDAGANDILPGRRTAAIARNHVVEIQVLVGQTPCRNIGKYFFAFKDVMPGEFHFFLRQPVENQEQNHRGTRIRNEMV